MQTDFSREQLKIPRIRLVNDVLRACVHCGFCTATCPTYVLLGDEADSPRGRIYMIKDMFETGQAASVETVKHLDRCLSCLSCMTTCPSGVHYMHLVDEARAHVAKTYRRPLAERLVRRGLGFVLPETGRFAIALKLARLARPFAGLFAQFSALKPVAAMLALPLATTPRQSRFNSPGIYSPPGKARGRVVLLAGCVQPALRPAINAATVRLLNRLGIEVVIAKKAGCCGALDYHMGQQEAALARARNNIDAWLNAGAEAVIINASGCGTTVKDYGHMLRLDGSYREKARQISAMAMDITEYLGKHGPENYDNSQNIAVTYHSACSMQHGQKLKTLPVSLLRKAGFSVREPAEAHLCCGSAGTYNILQAELAGQLKKRKLEHIAATAPQVIASGNIGCITQLADGAGVPVVHTVELLDWAHGGPEPEGME